MRLFFALTLPKELKDRLASFQQQVKRLSPPASWPDPGSLHLTLAFLGEQSDACVPSLMGVARRSASTCQAFTLKTGALGGFPSDRRARILWLGMEEEPSLEALCTLLR